MAMPPLLVLIVSGWGAHHVSAHPVFTRSHKPFLGDLVSSYPVAMVQAPAGGLAAAYAAMSGEGTGMTLAAALGGADVAAAFVADPDRFGMLQRLVGGQGVAHGAAGSLVSFPPGQSLREGYPAAIAYLKKQVISLVREHRHQAIFASFAGPWTASLYGDVPLLSDVVAETSVAIHRVVEEALEAGYRVLICSDSARLAAMPGEPEAVDGGAPDLLPVMLIHPAVEGLRASSRDVSHQQYLPPSSSGALEQLPSTIAALLAIPQPPGAAAPLFTDLIALTL